MKKLLLLGALLAFSFPGKINAQATKTLAIPPAYRERAESWLKNDRSGFAENKGQLKDQDGHANTAVKYLLCMPGLNVQLRSAGFSYDTWTEEKTAQATAAPIRKYHRVDIALEGADPHALLVAEQPLAEVNNVFNTGGSFEGIHSFRKVTYRNIYPGIDLEFVAKKGTDKPVEYNFIVHPGADASQIKMKYNSGSDISLKNGMIEMDLAFGTLKEKIPASYTQQDGQSLAVQYQPLDEANDLYAFAVPAYDHNKTLVIDPTPSLVWATYYGGSGADAVNNISVDGLGNIYVAGTTTSGNAIATAGTYQTAAGGAQDFFLAKFTAAGARLWATYIGGSAGEFIMTASVAVSGDAVYFSGETPSTGLGTAGTYQATYGGIADAYLGKFNSADGTRIWATYFGGATAETLWGMLANADGSVYIVGSTSSTTGIATAGALQTTLPGAASGYIARFDSSGALLWATYLGGTGSEVIRSIASDAVGNIYVTGYTTSTSGLATAGAFQQTYAGGSFDMFLAKVNSTGTAKLWCTYWGGDSTDVGYCVKTDPAGNVIVVGSTGTTANNTGVTSHGLASPGAMYTSPLGGRDVLIGKFSPSGSRLWSTYYGGAGNDMVVAADLDENGNIMIAGDGYTSGPASLAGNPSTGLATNCSYQPAITGSNEVFIAKISSDGNTRLWGTYLGSPGDERALAIKYIGNGNFLVGGNTNGTTGIATSGSYQSVVGGGNDAYFAKFSDGTAPQDVAVTASTISPLTQSACVLGIGTTITGNTVSLYNPPGFTSPIFYQWQVANTATGPWTDISGEIFKDLQPLSAPATQYYRRLVQVNNGYCDKKTIDSSAVATVSVNSNNAPVAHADGPQWYVCGTGANTLTLNGSATGGSGVYSSYQWYAGSNFTTPVATTASFTPTVSSVTTYTLKVTDNAGCVDIDQVGVVPVTANAGADVSMCENGSGVQIGTVGTPGGSVAYSWASISGSPVSSLSCTNCAQPIASPATTTTYQLTTTVTRKDGSTCSTTDNVTVTFVAAPTGGAGFGGTDKTICKSSTVVLGGVNDAAATYSWTPTAYLSAANVYNPTFDAGTNTVACPAIYTVTAIKNGCTFTDQVNIGVIDATTDQDNQTFACGGWCSGNTNNCSGATYSWQLVSGPGVAPTGVRLRNGNADAYLVNTGGGNAVYQRTTTLNGINCNSGLITVAPCASGNGCPNISIKMLTPQGCPKVFGQQDLQLYVDGINPDDYYFSWTPASIMDNAAAPVVDITATAATTVNVTITNKYTGQACSAPALAINNPAWALPVLNVTNKATCPGSPVAIGEPAVTGYIYAWSPATGLNLTNTSNPIATLSNATLYTVTKTDTSGCLATATVTVNVSDINFDAGPSHSVCNGATVTLGTTPGGSYTYSWTPANAAWTNGTGATDANPQVLFAGTTQTFMVTVTNPATGCQKTDTVTLSNTVTPGEYSGASAGPLCPGATAQLGTAPVPNASYSWSPATGLSCTNCAGPTVTAGAASQVYSVTVSYPGCATPITDNVTVSVNSLPAVNFADKTICASTPQNIGIGGTGNTASLPSAAGYQWSPATALSCTNCASPNANPVVATTYTATITLTNGCVVTDSVTVTPIVQATAKPDATICPGGSVVLGSPAAANVTYSWTILSGTAGSITPTNVAQPVANPTATSVYRLTATGTGPNAGCTVTDDVQVTVKALPALSITGTASVCSGSGTTLSVSPVTANIIYQWSPAATAGSPNSSSTVVTPTANTTYRVTQTDLNSGCNDYKEAIVTVWPNNVTATGGSISVCPATSATMPLTVTPASGTTIVWSPATYLGSPYTQNPVITPLTGGQYIVTVTDNASSCADTALVTVTVPASCLAYDFGDAPLVYENGNPASHGIVATLRIGAAIDAEGSAVSAVMNAPAVGDDNNSAINDEEGISFLPGVSTSSKTIGALVGNVLNNTGAPAYLVAWIDFNRDGDFNDAGEQSAVVTLASSATAANPLLQFGGFNTGCAVSGGPSYLRVRLTGDTTGGWNINPSPKGARSNGEVEDYAITIYGTDFSDAPLMYATASAGVNPDLNNDGKPDAAGSVWLGNIVDYTGCDAALTNLADGDDNTGMSDEDGLNMNGGITTGNTTATWDLTVNSQGPVNNVQWGIWVDWNADGVFDDFYHDSVNTASPVVVPITVTSPASIALNYVVRAGVKTGTAFAANQYNLRINNGEWEDFIAAPIPLGVTLLSFTATKKTPATALLQWKTAREEHSDHFIVERSANARVWTEAGRVKAAMTSETELNYSLTDYAPLPGTNYYRLRMVDKDGSYKLSAVRQLSFDREAVVVTVTPNPAHGMATTVFNEPTQEAVTMKLIDGFGRVVAVYELPAGTVRYPVSLETLAKGIYYLDIKGNALQAHLKLVVQ